MEEQREQEELLRDIENSLLLEDIDTFRELFLNAHVYEQAQLYLALSEKARLVLYHFLSPQEMADMFELIEEDDDEVINYLKEMDDRYLAVMLSCMSTDNAVDLLKELDPSVAHRYLRLMPDDSEAEIRRLYYYNEETAGGLMTTEFIAIQANQTVQSALTLIKSLAQQAETIYYIYVVDEEQTLVGVLSLRDLILNDDDTMIHEVMVDRIVSVSVNEDQKQVAQTVRDYDFLALPVVGDSNEMLGIITVDDVMDVMAEEASSDYSGLAAVDVDDTPLNPFVAATKRLPWLITLLFLGMGTSTLISQYEGIIAQASVLSVFVTLITGTAGNAGTQSLAVAVRQLSQKDDDQTSVWAIFGRELATGVVTGAVTGLTIMIVVSTWQHNIVLGSIVGIAMLCAITVAILAGSFIPLLMAKIGVDPAVASGPFITTLSDLTSVLIYFSIASIFLASFTN